MNCKALIAMGIFFLVDFIPLSAASQRQMADKKASAVQVSAIRNLVSNYMKENLIPGMSLAVVSEDVIVYAAGFGKADLENAVDVTPSTTFPSASTLKLITAVAVMQLVERGKLDLAEAIQHYCPAYPVKKWRISLKDLLRHQGGLGPEPGSQVFNRDHYQTVKDAVSAFASNELGYEPGTKTSYSNDGYTLLACAIEGATGQTYGEYVASHILQPAGMISTEPTKSCLIEHEVMWCERRRIPEIGRDYGPRRNWVQSQSACL